MQIAVCEDLQQDADQLCQMLRQYCHKHQLEGEIRCFSSGAALLEGYRPGAYHILFLDILMAGTDGMEVARTIRKTDQEVTIIFVTVSKEFAVESYLVDAAFYLVKPLEEADLAQAMERCRHLLQRYAKTISVAESRHMTSIRLRDILYLESQRNDCVLHTAKGEVRTRAKLSTLEPALDGFPFLRCHRSFIINLHWLEDMQERDFLLRSGARVPISRAYSAPAQQAFDQLLLAAARPRPEL